MIDQLYLIISNWKNLSMEDSAHVYVQNQAYFSECYFFFLLEGGQRLEPMLMEALATMN